jgi:uncharacterized protein YndB with AHSA1/START domain
MLPGPATGNGRPPEMRQTGPMAEHRAESQVTVAAPPSVVWPLLADIRGWPDWSPNDRVELVREGDPAPDGVGAERLLFTGRITVREEITVFEPGERLGYRLLSGLPMRDYRADITLTPRDEGRVTDVRWTARWRTQPPVPGFVMRAAMGRVLGRFTAALAERAEKAGQSDG